MPTMFTPDHEWINIEDHEAAVVGITLHAQDALGDVVFVDLPAVGKTLRKGEAPGAMAGVAGGVLAQTTQFVGLDVFGFPRSADLMIMLVLGGAGRLYGGLVGATVFMVAHHYLSDLNPVYWQFWLGLLLVIVVLYGRGGILGALDGLRARIGGRQP